MPADIATKKKTALRPPCPSVPAALAAVAGVPGKAPVQSHVTYTFTRSGRDAVVAAWESQQARSSGPRPWAPHRREQIEAIVNCQKISVSSENVSLDGGSESDASHLTVICF